MPDKLINQIEDFIENDSMQNRQVFENIYNNPLFEDFKTQVSKNYTSKEFQLFVNFLSIARRKFNKKILDEQVRKLKTLQDN